MSGRPDRNGPESSSWFFGLISVIAVVVLVAVGLSWWLSLLIAVAVGVLSGLARRRWPTI